MCLLVNTSLEGRCQKANEVIGKASHWQEVTMAPQPQLNLGTCHTVLTEEKLVLSISWPQKRVGGAKYLRQKPYAKVKHECFYLQFLLPVLCLKWSPGIHLTLHELLGHLG